MQLLPIILLHLFLASYSVHAQGEQNMVGRKLSGHVSGAPMTAAEVKAMPPVCITIGMGHIDNMFWAEAMRKNNTLYLLDLPENDMAKGTSWLQHYCWGMLSKFRAQTSFGKKGQSGEVSIWRGNMTSTIEYVKKSGREWKYTPLIYQEIAESYFFEKNYSAALGPAFKAIEINPRQVDAYRIIADSYAATGNNSKALEFVTEGLRYAAESKGLKRRYKEFGGKLPYPEPYPVSEPNYVVEPDEAKTKAATEGGLGKEGEPTSSITGDYQLGHSDSSAETTGPTFQPDTASGSITKEQETEMVPDKRNSANPFCRFCP